MRYSYKVFDMTQPKPEGEGIPFKMMYNMSLKKLQKTLDPKKSYKVRELTPIRQEDHVEVGETKEMEAMSLKKLRRKLDPKKKYDIEYRNNKNNYISRTIEGRNNGWSS